MRVPGWCATLPRHVVCLTLGSRIVRPTYSGHARDRMAERHVSEAEVEAVLADHYLDYPDKKGNRIFVGRPGSRRIKIVVAAGSNPPHIITVGD